MIRIAGKRTGVEVLGSEVTSFVPIDQVPTSARQQLQNLGFPILNNANLLANPDLWGHDLLTPTGQPLGQLILCNPDDERYRSVVESTASSYVSMVYAGLEPNTEQWIWASSPWPQTFILRGAEYPKRVLTTATDRTSYPMDVFDSGPLQTLFQDAAPEAQRWEIWTNLESMFPVGGMSRETDGTQRWWAHTAYVHGALIPPGTDGVWQFKAATTPTSNNAYVPLSQGQLPANPV